MWTRRLWMLAALLAVALGAAVLQAQDEGEPDVEQPEYAGDPRFPAPEFPTGLDWVNVPAPLTLADLRGKAVILDFWTYGCINCIHMIPVLRRLEEKYPNELVVIGVHSAKFENEGVTSNIRQIVQRYELRHPVINDNEFVVWRTYGPYGVNAWPTFAVIDPRGNILAVQSGEIPFEAFDRVIGGMIGEFDALGEIDREPIELALEGAGQPAGLLAYPGKVLADPDGNRLFIADSNHNRIVIADLDSYQVLDVIGAGARGFDDGAYDAATFDKPQGMTLNPAGDTLYVADVENHAIRAVNLTDQTVATIAGTGEQSYVRNQIGSPLSVGLNSPWDVLYGPNDILYIAMAGPHQLWSLDFNQGVIGPLVGSGREGLVNGDFAGAELAQPSGLHLHGNLLYFADSESSSIRVANLETQTVDTVAGPVMNNLFEFGDVDGGVGTSRLQHPLGVTGTEDGTIYVADTYNSRIKRIDPDSKTTTTVFGVDDHGFRDGGPDEAAFYEPGGLDYANGKLYIADTNNQAIRVIGLEANTVSTVTFPNPEALQLEGRITVAGGNQMQAARVSLDPQTVAPGAGEIVLRIVLPEGYKINEQAPSQVQWSSANGVLTLDAANQSLPIDASELRVPVTLAEGSDTLTGALNLYYCEAVQETLCYIDDVTVEVPVTVAAGAPDSEIVIRREITPPQVELGGL